MQIFHPEVTNVRQANVAIRRTLKEIPWIFGMTAFGEYPSFSSASVLSISTSTIYINQLKQLMAIKFIMV